MSNDDLKLTLEWDGGVYMRRLPAEEVDEFGLSQITAKLLHAASDCCDGLGGTSVGVLAALIAGWCEEYGPSNEYNDEPLDRAIRELYAAADNVTCAYHEWKDRS